MDGWMEGDEAILLFKCAQDTLRDAIIVEIGTGYGRSAVLLGLSGRRVITVDNYQDFNIQPETLREQFGDMPIEFMRTESVLAAEEFDNNSVDVLFIDGDHSYKGVSADINAWLPKVKQCGKVLFHDYGSYDGVTQAVDNVIAQDRIQKISQELSMIYCLKS